MTHILLMLSRRSQRLRHACAALLLMGLASAALAQQDLIIVRSMPAASGTTGSILSYEIAYKNGGPGAANGTQIAEQLPNGFEVLSLSCVGAFGGAVCPSTTILNNNPQSYPFPRIEGVIASFPEFAVVRLQVQMRLASNPGNFALSGTITGPDADPIANTNEVRSSLYVRPLLMDLATSHSSSLPAIGGANGQGGTRNVSIDGDTIDTQLPMSISYRLDNHGPDSAPGNSFVWNIGIDNFRNWVATNWTQAQHGAPVGYIAYSYSYTDPTSGQTFTNVLYDDARITPYTCQAIGNVTCPAAVLYHVADGWLTHAPQVVARTIVGSSTPNQYYSDPFTLEISSADLAEAQQHPDPLFGQSLPAGASLILTATLDNPSFGEMPIGGPLDPVTGLQAMQYQAQDGLFTATAQLRTSRCSTSPSDNMSLGSEISYSSPSTGLPLSTVSDSDLDNNQWNSLVRLSRSCPTTDIQVNATAELNGAPSGSLTQVYDNDVFSVIYTITNTGPSNAAAVVVNASPWIGGPIGTTFNNPLNWQGYSSAIQCTSSDNSNSPCPTQAQLNAWLNTAGTSTLSAPLASGANWRIRIDHDAGTTNCNAATIYNGGFWQANLQAWGAGVQEANEANNYEVNPPQFTFWPQPCTTPQFGLAVEKTANSAATLATAIEVGEFASFTLRLRNTSADGVDLKDLTFSDNISARRFASSNEPAYPNVTAMDEFQRNPAQANGGLNIEVTTWDPSSGATLSLNFPSGIVCTAHGSAVCPTSLSGQSTSHTTASAGSYATFSGTIPLLPAGADSYLELQVPWRALPDSYGCAPGNNNARWNENTVSLMTTPNTMAVLPDDSEVPSSQLGFATVMAAARTYNTLSPCAGGVPNGTIQKTLRDHGSATTTGANRVYESPVADGTSLTYDILLTSTGSTAINSLTFVDDKVNAVCRDGINSNPSGAPGQARCGVAVLSDFSCTATGGAICPSSSAMAEAVALANSAANQPLLVQLGSAGDYSNPTIPIGSTLNFTTRYTVSGLNEFTGAFSNQARVTGGAGREGYGWINSAVNLKLPQAPGISVAKDVDKLQARGGEVITYTIDITNGGNGALPAGAAFIDPLPAGLSAFASVSCQALAGPSELPVNPLPNCPTITNNASGLSASLPEMLPNTRLRITASAIAPADDTITSVGNEARVEVPSTSSTVVLPASANFAIPSAAEVAQASTLKGYKSVRNSTSGGHSVQPGETLVYTISYANTGGMDIANFQIIDSLPSHVSYSGGASVSTTGPISAASINPAFNGTTVTELLLPGATLAGASAITVQIPVTVHADAANNSVLVNQASATGSGVSGSSLSDNVDNSNLPCPATAISPCLPSGVSVPAGSVAQSQTASLDPTAVGVGAAALPAQLTLHKTVDQSQAQVGADLLYTLAISNTGSFDATGVLVDDVLPPQLQVLSASDSGTVVGNTVTWSLDVPARTSRTVTVTARVLDSAQGAGSLVNSAGLRNPAGFMPLAISAPCNADAQRSCATTSVGATAAVQPVPVPGLGSAAVALLAALLGLLGWRGHKHNPAQARRADTSTHAEV